MTNLPARHSSTEMDARLMRPTTPFSEKSFANLRRAMGRVGNQTTLMAGCSINQKGHEALINRASILRQALTVVAADRPLIGVELAKLVSALPKQDPGLGAALLVDAYREAIGDAPAWAVHAARVRIIRGEAGLASQFLPSPPELVRVIDDIVRPLRNDLDDLEALASLAPVAEPTAEAVTRVAKGLDELAASLRSEANVMPSVPIGEGPYAQALRDAVEPPRDVAVGE